MAIDTRFRGMYKGERAFDRMEYLSSQIKQNQRRISKIDREKNALPSELEEVKESRYISEQEKKELVKTRNMNEQNEYEQLKERLRKGIRI